ncbi:MAG TPA: DUF4383 domain-containing protein [Candidatus Tectomicrobia bacterium]|nr:DUF4383 domain-containing protein [Candidatus Tectomicrobia bacterium]
MGTRYFAFIVGLIYVLVGLLGFIPGARQPPPPGVPALALEASYGYLLGLFPINLLHNLVHLGVGIWGLTAYTTVPRARGFARGLAVFYGLLTVMGVIPGLRTLFGWVPLFGHDIWLHALTAMVAAYFGWRPSVATSPSARQRV